MASRGVRPISNISELDVCEEGRLATGILAMRGRCGDWYKGTKNVLVAAGLAKLEWFPSAPMPGKKPGTTKRVFKVQGDISLTDLNRGGLWEVRHPISEAEGESRSAEFDTAMDRKRAQECYERELQDAKKELAHMPNSHEAYRAWAAHYMGALLLHNVDSWCGPSKYRGYRFAQDVIDELKDHVSRMVEIVQTGRTVYSAEVHDARISEIRSKLAKADPTLQTFLRSVSTEERAP